MDRNIRPSRRAELGLGLIAAAFNALAGSGFGNTREMISIGPATSTISIDGGGFCGRANLVARGNRNANTCCEATEVSWQRSRWAAIRLWSIS
jgi:hypothetical protein